MTGIDKAAAVTGLSCRLKALMLFSATAVLTCTHWSNVSENMFSCFSTRSTSGRMPATKRDARTVDMVTKLSSSTTCSARTDTCDDVASQPACSGIAGRCRLQSSVCWWGVRRAYCQLCEHTRQDTPHLNLVECPQDVHVLAVLVGDDRELDACPLGGHLGQQLLQGSLLSGLSADGHAGIPGSANVGI
eukprot:GHRQ01036199.1.p1 GENE.GHRQ01036199.1~~GHRQ01036199.1.p1  ORF type:complete len:189 (+),score=12.22 GHRQ01036199.1:272-838(+)